MHNAKRKNGKFCLIFSKVTVQLGINFGPTGGAMLLPLLYHMNRRPFESS